MNTVLAGLSPEHLAYLGSLQTLSNSINTFLPPLLEHKPKSPQQFLWRHFQAGKTQEELVSERVPLVIAAPSGCGKGTFHTKLREEYPDIFAFSVSYTTRKPRPGEVHGVNYFYVTPEEFEQRVQQDDFIEHVEFAGNRYGTSKSYLEQLNRGGKVRAGC